MAISGRDRQAGLRLGDVPLVGGANELGRVLPILAAVAAGAGRLVLITGEAGTGIGKDALCA